MTSRTYWQSTRLLFVLPGRISFAKDSLNPQTQLIHRDQQHQENALPGRLQPWKGMPPTGEGDERGG